MEIGEHYSSIKGQSTNTIKKNKCDIMRNKFTLIELLIVISVIAILVSMLLPSLRSARYKATLAVCSSNLRQVGVSVSLYATRNNQFYPYRKNVRDNKKKHWSPPNVLRNSAYPSQTNDVPVFKSLDIEDLQCPLTYSNGEWEENSTSFTTANYLYLFGWQGGEEAKGKLFRTTDTMEFNGQEIDVIAGDVFSVNNWLKLGHNKRDGISFWHSIAPAGTWINQQKVDFNYARKDGSAFRINNIVYNDSRMKRVPIKNNKSFKNTSSKYHYIPVKD